MTVYFFLFFFFNGLEEKIKIWSQKENVIFHLYKYSLDGYLNDRRKWKKYNQGYFFFRTT